MSRAITTRPITPIAQAPSCTAAERRAGDLLAFLEQPSGAAPQLIEPSELTIIQAELRHALAAAPADEREARAEILTLIGSFPSKPDDPAIYLAALAKEGERWPAEVLRDARRGLVRSQKFLPAVAELAEACEAIQARRRMLLTAAERMERESRRRAFQGQQRDQLEAERRMELEGLHAALRNRFGALAIDVSAYAEALEAFRYAGNLSGDFRGDTAAAWASAYRRAEPWAVAAGRRAAVIGQARRRYCGGCINLTAFTAIVSAVVRGDVEGARHMLDRAGLGGLPGSDKPMVTTDDLQRLVNEALDRDACASEAEAFQGGDAA